MHWILILVLMDFGNSHISTITQEFNTQGACDDAITMIKANAENHYYRANAVCTPKGTD